MSLSKEAATIDVQKQSVPDKRDFNFYSAYDWSVWMVYGSSPFNSEQKKDLDVTVSPVVTNSVVPQSGSVVSQPASPIVSASQTSTTPKDSIPTPGTVPKLKPRESSVSEKLFFEGAEQVLINAGGAFLLGSNLAYIIESNTKKEGAEQRRNPFHPNPEEVVAKTEPSVDSVKKPVPFAQRKASTLPVTAQSGYRQAANAEFLKPAAREIEERAVRVAREGAQVAALAAAFSTVLQLNDKYFERKRDYLTYLSAGGLGGLAYGLIQRPFSPVVTIQRSLVLAGVGAVYSFAEEHLLVENSKPDESK